MNKGNKVEGLRGILSIKLDGVEIYRAPEEVEELIAEAKILTWQEDGKELYAAGSL